MRTFSIFSVASFGLQHFVTFQVFKKFGVGKYDPTNEQFDPNKHNAIFQVPDPKKAPGVVAVCLKVSCLELLLSAAVL